MRQLVLKSAVVLLVMGFAVSLAEPERQKAFSVTEAKHKGSGLWESGWKGFYLHPPMRCYDVHPLLGVNVGWVRMVADGKRAWGDCLYRQRSRL